jgi:hypothetical protein
MGRTVLASTRIPFAETISPTARRAVWLVALRELTDQMTSLRFLIIALLAIGLTPLAVYVGARDFKSRLADHDRLLAEKQDLIAKEGKWVTDSGPGLAVFRALRPPEPQSVLVRGLDGVMPAYWDFSPAGITSGPLASRPRRLADVLGALDLEFLIRVVLGLLAILLAFDAVAGEKELGTLRAVLSQPITRAALLAGKLAGGAVTLLVALTAALLVALLSAKLFAVDLLSASTLAKILLLGAASGAYLLCFYALGLLVSCLTSSQKTALVVLLVAWVFAVLAVSPLATLAAQAIAPASPLHKVEAQKKAIDAQLNHHADVEMGKIYFKIVGEEQGFGDPNAFRKHRDVIEPAIAPVLLDYVSKRRQKLSEIDRDAERQEERQNEITHALMALSPAAAFAAGVAELTGTGDAYYTAWLEAVRRQQSRLDSALFDDPIIIGFTHPTQNFGLGLNRREGSPLTQLPAFVPPRRDAPAALARALPSLGLLIVYTGVFIVGSFVAFARYDVR